MSYSLKLKYPLVPRFENDLKNCVYEKRIITDIPHVKLQNTVNVASHIMCNTQPHKILYYEDVYLL